MKKTLLITLLLIVGYSKEPINGNELVEKDGVMYTKDTNIPYSGDVFGLYKNGQKEYEGTLKDGELDGKVTEWYENGQKQYEETWKNGKEDGKWTDWYENGQKEYEGTYKDGKLDGIWVKWYKNGQKKYEGTYKDGESIEARQWFEDGILWYEQYQTDDVQTGKREFLIK